MAHSVLEPHLYTPASDPADKLIDIARGLRYGVGRFVMCTEDSVHEDDLPLALENIAKLLVQEHPFSADVFVRPRNLEVLKRLLEMNGVKRLEGFVIPKTTIESFPVWTELILERNPDFRIMPILEDRHMYETAYRGVLLNVLMDRKWRDQIDCVRLGGNDLMGYLGIRRDDVEYTIYDTPVGNLIMAILGEFKVLGGFEVSAPVFECFDEEYDSLFKREVRRSVMNGLFGQTVIHPRHIPKLISLYAPRAKDVASARRMLGGDTAVGGHDGKMEEVATHRQWAERIVERHRLFSTR